MPLAVREHISLPAGLTPRLGAALVLLLLSLGLPWAKVGPETEYLPGWFSPGYCYTGVDGYMTCTPGWVQPGYVLPGQGAAITGYATSARVFLVAAVAILAWALVRHTAPALGWAIILTGTAVLLTGTALRAGAIAAVLALVLLLLERRAARKAEPEQREPRWRRRD